MAKIITGEIARREVTRRGWNFSPFVGSVRVTGEFFIRAGSVTIFRGPDLVKQWEDSMPGIRWVKLAGTESVTCVSTTIMLIAAAFQPVAVPTTAIATVPSVVLPQAVLGGGGWLSLEIWRGGVRSPEVPPWMFTTGSMVTTGAGFPAGATSQIDPSITRRTNQPNWGDRFASSNTMTNFGDAAANPSGVVLLANAGTSRALPFYHRANVPQNPGGETTVIVCYFEIVSAAAQFAFSAAVSPANFVRSVFAPVNVDRSDPEPVEIRSQAFIPNWTPAAGNQVCAFVFEISGRNFVGTLTTNHATGHVLNLSQVPASSTQIVAIAPAGGST